VTIDSLKPGNQIVLVGKGGKTMLFDISPELHRTLALYLGSGPRLLAPLRAYQSAFRRAILSAGGRVTGTHGVRRRAARDLFSTRYRDGLGSGLTPKSASDRAAGDTVQALGHSRDRRDHRRWYLGK
jgi:hypothetical protein